uniref:Lipase n=1 Tax=Panagrolaimus superbus TaxID=310955 RepID=A0A914Z330_9BILA
MLQHFIALLLFVTVCFGQDGPLTANFQTWLQANGYGDQDFPRVDFGTKGSFGGKDSDTDAATRQPVVFIHGNSDAALKYSFTATGWSNSIEYFLQKGYKSRELYATSWGDANALNAASRTHDCATLGRLRKFLEAVISYTNATKIDIISHSMGVTIGRKIVKGGKLVTTKGTCDLGPSLAGKVDTFVGLAGGNYGLCDCEGGDALISATCNKKDGFWPGDSCGFNTLDCGAPIMAFPCSGVVYSSFLTDLNKNPIREGSYIFSAWSLLDDVILYEDLVWGNPTSLIPNSTKKKVYSLYTHMETKELTAEDQFDMVVHHIVA